MGKIKAMSLFANVGIAETYLKEIGIDVVIANELDHQRVEFYKYLYPSTNMIEGDITNSRVQDKLIELAKREKIDLIMATPPCQGMSLAGKMDPTDIRNLLIKDAVKIIKSVKPKYIFFENVPEQLNTYITYNNSEVLIPDFLKQEFGKEYNFNDKFIINAADYGVPQLRERAIILLSRRDTKKKWNFPEKSNKIITMENAIGNLPSLDPEIYGNSVT